MPNEDLVSQGSYSSGEQSSAENCPNYSRSPHTSSQSGVAFEDLPLFSVSSSFIVVLFRSSAAVHLFRPHQFVLYLHVSTPLLLMPPGLRKI